MPGKCQPKMKTPFIIFVLAAFIGIAQAVDTPVDLTGADATAFKAHLGQTVVLRGRLEQGMQGPCLIGATATNVVFYVIPEIAKDAGYYSYPSAWTRLEGRHVRITGELNFRSFDRSKAKPTDQVAPDFYYMVLQRTKIESAESK